MLIYKTTPAKQNNINTLLAITFGVCGIFLYLSTLFFPKMPLPWLAQCLAVCLVAGCIYCITWIIKGKYMYVVEDSGIVDADGNPKFDLVVVRIGNNTSEALCRIGVNEINEVSRIIRVLPKVQQKSGKKGSPALKYTSKQRIEQITDLARTRKTYKYQVDMLTKNETVIVTEDLVIRLTFDKGLEETLKSLTAPVAHQ